MAPAPEQQQQQQQRHDVTFEVADVMTRDFPEGWFDAVFIRDTLLHLENKPALFARWVGGGLGVR
jgi:phosphoethanolamine N-methyltransferase